MTGHQNTHVTSMQCCNAEKKKNHRYPVAQDQVKPGETKYHITHAREPSSDRRKFKELPEGKSHWWWFLVNYPAIRCLFLGRARPSERRNRGSKHWTRESSGNFSLIDCGRIFFHELFSNFIQSQREAVKKSVEEARKELQDMQVTNVKFISSS